MILQYFPSTHFVIDSIALPFGTPRELVRAKLGGGYTVHNEEISLDDETPLIIQRRDIYGDAGSTVAHYFLNYDNEDQLTALEVHWCKKIKIFDIEFNFRDEADLVAMELSNHSPMVRKGEGEYFFPELHLMLIDEMHMGGTESNTVGYFYGAALNIL